MQAATTGDLITAAAASINMPDNEQQKTQTAPTLAQLNASLVMIPAKQVYHVKHKKSAKDASVD